MIAVISLCSDARLDHLLNQLESVPPTAERLVVWLADTPSPVLPGVTVIRVPPAEGRFRLARARNAGADAAIAAGADLLVFLDADCVAGPDLLDRYEAAAAAHPQAVLCGPVTYLPEESPYSRTTDLAAATRPHPARPAPADHETVIAAASQYRLFWSLSFALTASTWQGIGGFHDSYAGYGGEDTDFAFTLLSTGTPLAWVGGAHAYHQYHPTSSPPWQHLDDILRNGRLFADRWGEWPMEGWLREFEAAGAVERRDDGWVKRDAYYIGGSDVNRDSAK
jgi:N-acetylglucosaminyl-diphospho-decaprenol L-rhamnosyltransferase